MSHTKMFNILEKVAEAMDPVFRVRIASALVYRNEIISFGVNRNKTHPLAKKFGKNPEAIYLHSEIECIKNALRSVDAEFLTKCRMYILRLKCDESDHKQSIRGLARPCCGCQHGLEQFGIKKVLYSLDNEGYDEL